MNKKNVFIHGFYKSFFKIYDGTYDVLHKGSVISTVINKNKTPIFLRTFSFSKLRPGYVEKSKSCYTTATKKRLKK